MVRAEEGAAVPVLLFARPPLDAAEEHTIRKLTGARHAPGDWIQRARMIAHSWDGLPHHRPGPLGAARPPAPGRRGTPGPRRSQGPGALDPGRPGRARPSRGHPG